jgi:hypothetical protein
MNTIVIEAKQCPNCGGLMAAGALAGLCPACLLAQGAESQAAPEPAFQPPPLEEVRALFPQLEIVAILGAGGMGAVYKARQPALDRWVALKILPAHGARGVNFSERFNREARALARLNHPNIVAVHEFGQAGHLHYFLMEYVDGANLRQLEQAGRLSAREALQIIPQICDALQYAHDEGVVHRDIKPENVLVDRKGRVKIADFGLAKIVGQSPDAHRLTAEGQVMGTPHYMAPEQMERPLAVDHRADIYSLGVVFYEMLTGDLPLGKFSPPSKKVQLDIRLDEVVLRALENDPERRFQRASEVKSHVETISTTEGARSSAQSSETSPPAPSGATQRKYLYWAGFPVVEELGDERTVSWNGTLSAAAAGFAGVALGWIAAGLITGNWNTPGGSRIGLIAVAVTVAWGLRRTLNRPWNSDHPVTPQGTAILRPARWWQWKYRPFVAIGLFIVAWGVVAAKLHERRGNLPDGIKVSQHAKNTSGKFIARLPDGGTVELLAVGEAGAGPNGWWSGDGTIIPNSGYEVRAPSRHHMEKQVSKDVLFRMRDLPTGASMAGFSADPASGNSSGGRVFYNGKPLDGAVQVRFAWNENLKEANLRVGLALKPWRTIATASATGTSQTHQRDPKDPYWKVQFHHAPVDTEAGARVTMVFAPESRMWVHRLVAVDTNGAIHDAGSAQGSPIEGVFLWTYTVHNLSLAAIKEFQVQVRPVHWVEFHGVALKPAGATGDGRLAFTRAREQTFDEVIDFDSMVTTNFPVPAVRPAHVFDGLGDNIRWMQENGFDAEAGTGELRPLDMDFVLLKDSDWSSMSAEEVQDKVYRNYYHPRSVKPEPGSSTFGFRTREHGVGMLQIVKFAGDRPGVTLRYKMVQRHNP